MERLTYRHKDQDGNPTDCISQQINLKYVPRKDWLEKIAIRLADIEDILGDDYDLDRLRELVQSDRDGRCVVLLSNDDVYTIRGDIVNGIIKANCRDACKPPKSALKGDQHG